MRIVNLTIGFTILLFAISLLGPKLEPPKQQQPIEHNHKDYPTCIANGLKCTTLTVCGDTSTVFNSGRHVPISDHHMSLIIDKPE